MFMTAEKIDPPAAPPAEETEHPTVRAARMIKDLHLEHIAKIDGGFEFHKKLENGEMVDCSDEMRIACMEQIERCDMIIEAAAKIPAEKLDRVNVALIGAQEHIRNVLDDAVAASTKEDFPEIGNYDHEVK